MECQTFSHTNKKGEEFTKAKVGFLTLDKAITHAITVNMKPNRVDKVVPYKCKKCHKFHLGRNGTIINDKYREKHTIRAKANPMFTVVGKIDLDEFTSDGRRRYNLTKVKDSVKSSVAFKVVGKIDLSKIPNK